MRVLAILVVLFTARLAAARCVGVEGDRAPILVDVLRSAGISVDSECKTTVRSDVSPSGWHVHLTDEAGTVTTFLVETEGDAATVITSWLDAAIEPNTLVAAAPPPPTSSAPVVPRGSQVRSVSRGDRLWYAIGSSAASSVDGALWVGPAIAIGRGPLGIVTESRFDTNLRGDLVEAALSRARHTVRATLRTTMGRLHVEADLGLAIQQTTPAMIEGASRGRERTFSQGVGIGVAYAFFDRVVVSLRHEWVLGQARLDYASARGPVIDDPRRFLSLGVALGVGR